MFVLNRELAAINSGFWRSSVILTDNIERKHFRCKLHQRKFQIFVFDILKSDFNTFHITEITFQATILNIKN
jgi:hypothetical protein